MKKTILSLFSLTLILISANLVLTSSSNGRAFAANSGNTGAPSETTTCRSCHGSGFGTTVSISITDTSGSTVTEYIPGDTLNVKVNVEYTSGSPSRYGFQIVSLTSSNVAVNEWISPSSNTRIDRAGVREYAEHKGKSVDSTFTAKWVGPLAGTGTVTFYAGGAAVNNNGGTSGDGGNTTSISLTENVSTSIFENVISNDMEIYPNPAVDFLYVRHKNKINENDLIEIRDLQGKLVFSTLGNQESTSRINIQGIDSGIYFLTIQNSNGDALQSKFVKN